jgi:membrane protein YdbS with pleckstrin-like domain
MLASTAFDGLRDTKVFARTHQALPQLPGLDFWLLLLLPVTFLALYMLCMVVMRHVARSQLSVRALAAAFSLSIVPIAVAYNVAHYWTLLVIQGQQLITLASNPFGWGWNIFGTAGHKIDVGVVNAATVWYSQVALIVFGHIVAVYLAHRIALRLYSNKKQAMASQYPMLLLMLLYTMMSLWIIAQPITVG